MAEKCRFIEEYANFQKNSLRKILNMLLCLEMKTKNTGSDFAKMQ